MVLNLETIIWGISLNGKLMEVLGVLFPQVVGEETMLDGVQVAGLSVGLLT
jgi:hypothetical protein